MTSKARRFSMSVARRRGQQGRQRRPLPAPHPAARTTFGYVMIAMFVTDEKRVALGAAVTDVHRHVRSGPGDPVRYSALGPKLQPESPPASTAASRTATPPYTGRRRRRRSTSSIATGRVWPRRCRSPRPPDRAAFEEYLAEATARIEMDEVSRAYLYDFAGLGFLPWPMPALFGWFHRAVTAGFLPAAFRYELGLAWSGHVGALDTRRPSGRHVSSGRRGGGGSARGLQVLRRSLRPGRTRCPYPVSFPQNLAPGRGTECMARRTRWWLPLIGSPTWPTQGTCPAELDE